MEIYGVYEGTLHVVLKRSIVELEGASAAQRDPPQSGVSYSEGQ